jgi:hypothetical protein
MKIVEVDNAVGRDTVLRDRQVEFGDQPSSGSCHSCDDHSADPVCHRVSGQYEHWAVTTRSRGKPDLTPLH